MTGRAPLGPVAHSFGRLASPLLVMWLMSGVVRVRPAHDAGSRAFQYVALLIVWAASGAFRDAFSPRIPPVGAQPGEPQRFLDAIRSEQLELAVGVLQSRSGASWFGIVSGAPSYSATPYVGVLSRQERETFLAGGAIEVPLIPRRLPLWRAIPKDRNAMPELVFAVTFPAVMALLRYVVAELPASHCAAFAGRMAVGMTIVFTISRYWYYARIETALASKDTRGDCSSA